jgi:hypothetical protein
MDIHLKPIIPLQKEEIPSVPKIKKIILKKKKAVQVLTAFMLPLLANCPQAASISLPSLYALTTPASFKALCMYAFIDSSDACWNHHRLMYSIRFTLQGTYF